MKNNSYSLATFLKKEKLATFLKICHAQGLFVVTLEPHTRSRVPEVYISINWVSDASSLGLKPHLYQLDEEEINYIQNIAFTE